MQKSVHFAIRPDGDRVHYGHYVFHRTQGYRYLEVIDCEKCGFVHQAWLPSPEKIAETHKAYYESDAPLLEQDPRQRWYWRTIHRQRMDEIDRWAPGKRGRKRRSILDWGAGLGGFVNDVDDYRGWTAWGYEPCEIACHRAPAGPPYVFSSSPDRWARGKNRFHAVYCSLVLEHVRDPQAELGKIRRLLLPGGVLMVVVPNEFNSLQERLGEKGYSPVHPMHVNYFTGRSIRELLQRSGFAILDAWSTFPIEWLALHGLDYVRRPWAGRIAHLLRMIYDAALWHLAPVLWLNICQEWFDRGVGREVVILARGV